MKKSDKILIRKWSNALDGAYKGHGYQLKLLKPKPDNVPEVLQKIEASRNAYKRDLMKHPEMGFSFIADVHYEVANMGSEDALIDAIDAAAEFPKLRSVEDIDLKIEDFVRVRVPGHYYDCQRGKILATRGREFLIQILTKKVPIKTNNCNKDAPALVWLSKKDLRKE